MPTGVYERSDKEKARLRQMVKAIAPVVPKGSRLSPATQFKKGNVPWNKGKKWPEMSGENHPSRKPEHAVALAALEALRAQMIENEILKERIAELESK